MKLAGTKNFKSQILQSGLFLRLLVPIQTGLVSPLVGAFVLDVLNIIVVLYDDDVFGCCLIFSIKKNCIIIQVQSHDF